MLKINFLAYVFFISPLAFFKKNVFYYPNIHFDLLLFYLLNFFVRVFFLLFKYTTNLLLSALSQMLSFQIHIFFSSDVETV